VDTKRLLTGTLLGGITLYAVGYLIWGQLFAAFFAANVGSATGVARDRVEWALALGNLSQAALVTLAIGSRPGSATIGAGFRVGAIVAFLAWLGVDLIQYSVTNVFNLTATLVDPLLQLVHGGIGGAVIGAVFGKMPQSGGRA